MSERLGFFIPLKTYMPSCRALHPVGKTLGLESSENKVVQTSAEETSGKSCI
jgi:hypothetical protein